MDHKWLFLIVFTTSLSGCYNPASFDAATNENGETKGETNRDDRATPVPQLTALDEYFGTAPASRQEALDAFASLHKRAGHNLYFAPDGITVTEARLGLGGINENMVSALRWFPEIESVSLSYFETQDEWLAHLKPLANLKLLNLSGAPVTDAGMVHLEALTSLEDLRLSNTKVTDTGMKSVAKLTNLRSLVAMKTQITNQGLDWLEQLPNLRLLSIRGSQVTQEGVDKFKQAHPECKILPIK